MKFFPSVLLLLSLFSGSLWAEEIACYRLYLKDKAGSGYCALSERAVQRRERQGVQLDESDRCVSEQYKQQLCDSGLQIVTQSRWLNTVVVKRPDGALIADEQLQAFPFVSRYEAVSLPVAPTESAPRRTPVKRVALEGTTRVQQAATEHYSVPIRELHGEALYEQGFRGEGMLIAVLDGGFQNMPDLPELHKKVVGWFDPYVPNDSEGMSLWSASFHGTHVMSIMAADTTLHVWGTAPQAEYFLIRTEFDDTETPLEEDMWVAGAEYADSVGADLINTSLGYHTFDNEVFNHSWDNLGREEVFVSQGAAIACQKGMMLCVSAGNDRDNAWKRIAFPADVEAVMTVGASDAKMRATKFTGEGWVLPDEEHPGQWKVKPDVSGRGLGTPLIDPEKGEVSTGAGTSYSCPLICGLIASLWSADPTLKVEELRRIVRESSSLYATPDSLLGYGFPDFSLALKRVLGESGIQELATKESVSICYDLQGSKVAKRSKNGCFIVQNGKKKLILPR